MAVKRRKSIGDSLVERQLLTEDKAKELKDKERSSGKKLRQLIVEEGLVSEESLCQIMSEELGIPYIDLDNYLVDPEVLKGIPADIARRYRFVPLFLLDEDMTIAVSDPMDVFLIDAIRNATGKSIDLAISTESAIKNALSQYYGKGGAVQSVLETIKGSETAEDIGRRTAAAEAAAAAPAAVEAPVIRLVNVIIQDAVREGASDIHINPEKDALRIRYRVDGLLHEVSSPQRVLHPAIVTRIKVMADMNISESRAPQDGRIRLTVDDREVDVRVSMLPTIHGENVVMRLLVGGKTKLGIAGMGFPENEDRLIREMIKNTWGILLVTGPTGSGKTTTLYSVLSELNSVDKNIITVEDPVEYRLELIRQVQVNPKANLTFASGLRSILRQDPDIIMVGEIRDLETAEIAVQSALTGHLVLSTLHTNDAPSSVIRLMDMGVEPFLIASSVIGVCAQRLVRTICPNCKAEVPMNDAQRLALSQLGVPVDQVRSLFKGKGCGQCRNSGYTGRTGIFEMMPVDDHMRELIMAGEPVAAMREAARALGMRTLKECGVEKVLRGQTTLEEVLRVA